MNKRLSLVQKGNYKTYIFILYGKGAYMRNLNRNEIEMVGAGGSDRNHYHGGPNASSASQNWRGGGYGGQANGFVSNSAATGQGLGQGACSNGVGGGIIAGAAGGPLGFGLGVVGGALAGGCFNKEGNQK